MKDETKVVAAGRRPDAKHGVVNPPGVATTAGVLSAYVKAGDHLLTTDNVCGPARRFVTRYLARPDDLDRGFFALTRECAA